MDFYGDMNLFILVLLNVGETPHSIEDTFEIFYLFETKCDILSFRESTAVNHKKEKKKKKIYYF